MAQIDEGEIVKSKVLRVTRQRRHPRRRLQVRGLGPARRVQGPPDLKEGDEVEVFLEHLEDQEGAVVLSKKKADFMRVWEKIRVAYESDQPVEGTLVKKIKGGVVVEPDGRGRVPPRRADRAPPGARTSTSCSGQTYEFKIIKLNKRRRNIVVEPPGDPGERAGRQARAPDEGARSRPGAEGRGQEHHRLRRLHRPRRRGRPAPHHRHVVRPRLAPDRDGRDRHGGRGQGPRHRLAARAHLPRPEAAAVATRGRTSPRSTRSARGSRARSSRSPTTARSSSSSRASRAWCTSPR